MEGQLLERYQTLLRLAESTDQSAFRDISAFAVATDRERDEEAREAGRTVLVKAAKTFTQLLSMTFQAVAWNKDVLYDEDSFRAIYERVLRTTERFARVDQKALARLLADYPASLLILRSIAALSLDEIALLMREREGIVLSKDQMREFELGREVGKADTRRWHEASNVLAGILFESIAGSLLELPASARTGLFRDRKNKTDTRQGWETVRAVAERGIAYWELLYQRYMGGFFRQAMDASSAIKGDILELALVQLFNSNRIPFYRTKAREKISAWEQAPDFLLPNRESPTVAIEAKLAEDGGTARDKAARVERLCLEARGKGVFPVAVIDGKGFYRINDVTAVILRDTHGETYTLKTLDRILSIPQVAELRGRR